MRHFAALHSSLCLALVITGLTAGCSENVPTAATTSRAFNPTASTSRVATPVKGRHVFALSGGIPADFAARVTARGGSVVNAMPEIGVVVAAGLSDADAESIAGKDQVAPDYVSRWVPTAEQIHVSSTSLPPRFDAAAASPLSAFFLRFQWNMFQIHADAAWRATPQPTTPVRVAILDSGLDPYHIDQQGLIDMGLSKAFAISGKGPPAWEDDFFHGTFVGGIVTSNNLGVAGVSPNVKLVAVKVLDSTGVGSFGNIIAGIYYSVDQAHAQVINMSLGALFPKSARGGGVLLGAMSRAVNYAKRHGALVVAAAGNDTTDLQHDNNFVSVPCESGVNLCVSATTNVETLATYSNFGASAINLAAPGGDGSAASTLILSLCSSVVCGDPFSYGFGAGTSASAPHVSGLAAYIQSQYGGTLSTSELIKIIERTADDIGTRGKDPFFGYGRINVVNALATPNP